MTSVKQKRRKLTSISCGPHFLAAFDHLDPAWRIRQIIDDEGHVVPGAPSRFQLIAIADSAPAVEVPYPDSE
jgi:hypothetical protein